jgi:predicted nucleic acid-binding protein
MAIVDNCILSSLAKIERLELLKDFFSHDVKTPPSVMDELGEEAIRGFDFVKAVRRVMTFSSAVVSPKRWLLVTPLTEEEEELSATIMAETGLAKPDADCIALGEKRKEILLTDDAYAGRVAQRRQVQVFDLKTFLEACIVKGIINTLEEVKQIILELKKKDFYEFSSEDQQVLFSYFES